MEQEARKQLAIYLQDKLHDYCSGFMFDDDQVLLHINEFFQVADLIKQRDELQKQIDEATK
jgi:hypothetical protein